MKRFARGAKRLAAFGLLMLLADCSGAPAPAGPGEQAHLVSPYPYTESQAELLRLTGLTEKVRAVRFDLPPGCESVKLTVYQLDGDGAWQAVTKGELRPQQSDAPQQGVVAFMLGESGDIISTINLQGQATYQTEAPLDTGDFAAFSNVFLGEAEQIQWDAELPVGMLLYSLQPSVPAYELNDFFEPGRFAKEDIVQAITLKFTN